MYGITTVKKSNLRGWYFDPDSYLNKKWLTIKWLSLKKKINGN